MVYMYNMVYTVYGAISPSRPPAARPDFSGGGRDVRYILQGYILKVYRLERSIRSNRQVDSRLYLYMWFILSLFPRQRYIKSIS